MGLSRNKVAVPEGAAGSPPFYGDSGRGSRPVSPPGRMVRRRWGCWCGRDRWLSCGMGMLLGSRTATGPSGPASVRHTGSRPSPWWGSRVRVPVVVVVRELARGREQERCTGLVYCNVGRPSSCRGFVLCSDRFVIISAKICCPVFAGFVAGGRVVAREGRMVDALADSTDEGRVRLR